MRRCKRSITWAMQALVDDNHAAQEELWEAQGLHLLVRQLHDCASWQQQQQLLQQPTHSAAPLQSIPSSSMSPPVSPVGLDRRSSSMLVCLSALIGSAIIYQDLGLGKFCLPHLAVKPDGRSTTSFLQLCTPLEPCSLLHLCLTNGRAKPMTGRAQVLRKIHPFAGRCMSC